MRLLIIIVIVAMAALSLIADDLAGTRKGSMNTQAGEIAVTITNDAADARACSGFAESRLKAPGTRNPEAPIALVPFWLSTRSSPPPRRALKIEPAIIEVAEVGPNLQDYSWQQAKGELQCGTSQMQSRPPRLAGS